MLVAGIPLARADEHGQRTTHRIVVADRDTLIGVLAQAGVPRAEARVAERAVVQHYDARRLQPGDVVILTFQETTGAPPRLAALHLETRDHRDLTVVASPAGTFVARTADWGVSAPRRVTGRIGKDFKRALEQADVPAPIAAEVLAAFAFDADFPSPPDKAARFLVVYDPAQPALRFASVVDRGREHSIYRYALGDSETAFVSERGQGVARMKLGRPIVDYAYISSPFGWRVHPVLGVRKFHRGIDYAAAPGTPVRAAADGVIDDLGERGNYGRYIRISHDDHVATAYAHLRSYASHLKVGSTVRRGQVIGYVGASGLATGPHLYYEVLVDNHQVNPAHLPAIRPIALDDVELAAFRNYVHQASAQAAE